MMMGTSKTTLKSIIPALEELRKFYKNIPDDLLEEIAESGLKYLRKEYKNSPNRIDPNIDFDSIDTSYKKIKNGFTLIARSPDILYEEFGTGDKGENSPHPAKNKFNLNPYNSGIHIRNVTDVTDLYTFKKLQEVGISSGKFWHYKKSGISYYTQGIPAGKEMWNTRNYLLSDKGINRIVRKRVDELHDKFVKSIKK